MNLRTLFSLALPSLAAATAHAQAGLLPTRDAIGIEDAKGPYANLIAVRTADKDKPWVAQLLKAYQSAEVRQQVEATFSGSVVAAF